MPSQAKFKPSALSHSMHLIFKMQGFPKLICGGFLISSCISVACAQEKITELAKNEALESSTTQLEAKTVVEIKINSKHNAIEIFFFIKI